MKAVANGSLFCRDCSPCLAMLVLCGEEFHIQLTKKCYGRHICFWRNCGSVPHDRNKVLLFPLKLIVKRVEFVALNFIVFLQAIQVFFPSLFVLT